MELRINACKYKQDPVRTPALALQQVNSVDDSWGRRTTALCVSTGLSGDKLISKETCRHNGRRFKLEEEVSKHIYTEGAITGVARLKDCEYVRTGGEPLEIGLGDDIRRKMRLALLADGEYLREAKSVNDLLKTFYDVLEVHRTVYLKRQDLHCDMSMFNVLMCPRWAKVEARPVFKNKPPLIQDVLGESFRHFEDRTAQCMVLDVDNSAILRVGAMDEDKDLAYRTGKPMYIARSACVGKPQNNALSLTGVQMPTLTEEAERLYVKAYGQPRYDRFTDKIPYTFHGGNPPDERPDPVPSFVHRACHDAESIFWTMLDALLLASLRIRSHMRPC
ncbi:hypothetical protein K466DRAFT_323722 [Polyporus arcularius HHB13444]|uniref:Fungal-type protein kinase domain-containing protein n=1 Tax=Polyporus arcularius HHB13444 TaxID=1314778 RepID=A0A5C3NZN0_9APHY|nr:hypothetical protein K466DRAFT_323722 [Polyporus arcularius HHB13444]